jgi:nucleotide-binding universal stress UspA family protein
VSGPPVFGRILVPLDGSRLALRILEPLERLVLEGPTELTLLRVVDPRSPVEHDRLPAAELAMQLQLRIVRERLGLDVRMRLELVRGDPAEEIVRYAQGTGQELVAMATHGRSGVGRLLRGSVAEEVLRTCDVPLLLCNPRALDDGRLDARFRRVLVALDGSARSERVLPVVERVATAHQSLVTTLRVEVSPVSPPRQLAPSSGPVERLAAAGLEADALLACGDVVAELLEASQEADLLAMATHGRSGASRWWFGSVTEEVLRQARCPLLVVRAA